MEQVEDRVTALRVGSVVGRQQDSGRGCRAQVGGLKHKVEHSLIDLLSAHQGQRVRIVRSSRRNSGGGEYERGYTQSHCHLKAEESEKVPPRLPSTHLDSPQYFEYRGLLREICDAHMLAI